MAILTQRWSPTVQPDLSPFFFDLLCVALTAGYLVMRAGQREIGLVVIERGGVPLRNGVTAQTFLFGASG